MTTKKCPQCDKRPWELSRELEREWLDSGRPLCPPCLAKWQAGMATAPTGPRCGGCGKAVASHGVCAKCEANRVEAPSLSDQTGGAV
jgi:hypothetical protein